MVKTLRRYCLVLIVGLGVYWIWLHKTSNNGTYLPPGYSVPVPPNYTTGNYG